MDRFWDSNRATHPRRKSSFVKKSSTRGALHSLPALGPSRALFRRGGLAALFFLLPHLHAHIFSSLSYSAGSSPAGGKILRFKPAMTLNFFIELSGSTDGWMDGHEIAFASTAEHVQVRLITGLPLDNLSTKILHTVMNYKPLKTRKG